MESRTRLAIGGMTAVAASVAVICAVALTNSVALSDAEGSSVEADRVVVPASGIAASGGAEATPRPVETAVPRVDVEAPTPEAEVVPAPAPEVVGPPSPSPSVPVAEPPAGTAVTPSDDAAIAEAEASGSWASVREWAARLGWSKDRTDAWIAKLEESRGAALDGDRDRGRTDEDDRNLQQSDSTRRESTTNTTTQKVQERSMETTSSEERPANAGANADHRSMKPGVGAKKDRSRDSPERRDR